MRLVNALKKNLWIAIVSMVAILIILPVIQTGFLQNSINAWFLTLIKSPFNTLLYIIFSILFGAIIALQFYIVKNPKICKDCATKKGTSTGYFGASFGFLVGVCPACIGLLGLILPLGASITLTYYGWAFMLVAIGIMTVSIYLLGGFKEI